MPVYEYKCECGYEFEDLNRISQRHQAECLRCGKMAKMRISPVRLDPNMDTPGARMAQRRAMERRGRGRDMTSANKDVQDDQIRRDSWQRRRDMDEGKLIVS